MLNQQPGSVGATSMENPGLFIQRTFNASSENVPLNSNGSSTNSQTSPSNHQMKNHNSSDMGMASDSGQQFIADNYSPLHLSSVLRNMSLATAVDPREVAAGPSRGSGSYSLKVWNLPADLTHRESQLIFSLATGITKVELREEQISNSNSSSSSLNSPTEPTGDAFTSENLTRQVVVATFNSLSLVKLYASILSNKYDLVGEGTGESSKLTVEVVDNISQEQIPFSKTLAENAIGQSNYQLTTSSNYNNVHLPRLSSTPVGSASSNGKTMSISSSTQTKSRFSFSDPFTNELGQVSQGSHSNGSNNNNNANMSQQEIHIKTQTLTRDSGKSLLLMENDDINENIWNPNTIPSGMDAFQDLGVQNVNSPLDWSMQNNRSGQSGSTQQNSAMFMGPNSNSVAGSVNASSVDVHSNMLPMHDNMSQYSLNSVQMMQQQQQQQQQVPIISQDSQSQYIASNNYSGIPNKYSRDQQNMHIQQQQQQRRLSNSGHKNLPKGGMTTDPQMMTSGSTKYANVNGGNSGSVSGRPSFSGVSEADLSLLSKIPPPANPADQNPPCNTLYVGNLPPDATEQELRVLFADQEGFRRLSFRNKNLNHAHNPGHSHGHGHGHGPMCFVEFDDVSFATRALAELYGRQLPRPTVSSKGGIRLSFSKNPLGVRGPNNRKSNSSGSTGSSTPSAPMSTPPANNFSYAQNYQK